jgi:hypothetical protein
VSSQMTYGSWSQDRLDQVGGRGTSTIEPVELRCAVRRIRGLDPELGAMKRAYGIAQSPVGPEWRCAVVERSQQRSPGARLSTPTESGRSFGRVPYRIIRVTSGIAVVGLKPGER